MQTPTLTEPIDCPAWYAVYTRYQHEKTAARILESKTIETFLPLYSAVRRWSDRIKTHQLPLFPGYVFLKFELSRKLDVLTTPGVCHMVSVAGKPAAISEEEIVAMRRAEHTGRVEPHPFLKSGDWVRVTSGPLEGIEGILARKKNAFRLVLSVDLLQKSMSVEVDAIAVERVSRRASPPRQILPFQPGVCYGIPAAAISR